MVRSRGDPERGLSSPACVGSGAAGATEMLARGPPLAIWDSTRVCAVPATARSADSSAVASVMAIRVRAARPGLRRSSRPASPIASRQVIVESSRFGEVKVAYPMALPNVGELVEGHAPVVK